MKKKDSKSSKESRISKFESSFNSSKSKKKSKQNKSKSKKRKRYQSCKIIPRIPGFRKKLRQKLEEKEEIEFVLGDFNTFHKIDELKTFQKMTSLTLINESIKDISLIISNISNPENILYLCLNQNEINNIDCIDKLENLEELQINFNFIEKIPKSISKLRKLKKLWACENNISLIENLPNSIESLWLANNYIENIPENFKELINLKELNLSGNFISDLKDLYLIQEIKTLNKIYLSDINFGENPICYYNNYRNIMLLIFHYVEVVDQIKVTFEEKFDMNRCHDISIKETNDKIKNNFRYCNIIFRMMKTYLFFFSSVQLYKLNVLSTRLKYLEYKNGNNSSNNYEIDDLLYKIKINLEETDKMKNEYHKLKNFIKDLNDSFIFFQSLKLETYNNIEIFPVSPNTKWSSFCINLMKSQINDEFMKSNFYIGISFNEIYKIKHKKWKYIYNALYNDLIDEKEQFGAETKFQKFLYIIIPDKILQNKKKLYNFFSDNNQKSEENYFFCDNFSYLDEYGLDSDKKNKNNISIICKCVYFESNVDIIDARFNYFSSIEEIKNYLINLKSNSKKDIICLKIKYNVNFYIYNNKGIILPKYLIKYNYIKSDNSVFISCYEENENETANLKFNLNNEKLFNLCSEHFFNEDNEKNHIVSIKQKKIGLHYISNFYEYNQLDNSFFFFVKNSLIKFLRKCFKYKDKEEYFNEIKILDEKIKEINDEKLKDNFLIKYNKYIKDRGKSDINIRKIKQINLFNQNITTNIFNDLLKKISNDITKFHEISIMSIKCEILSLSHNNITEINLSNIFNFFPNLQKLDLSHNKISTIIAINKDEDINKFWPLKKLDISFNCISNLNIIKNLKNLLKETEIIYYGNPLEKNKELKEEKIQNNIINYKNNSNKIFSFFEYVCDFYSFNDEIKKFGNLDYFSKSQKFEIKKNFKDNILYLNHQKLINIPNIYDIYDIENENENDISNFNIIHLNYNKIKEIKNITNLINLEELYLQGNKIQLLENFPSTLKKLDISNNYITNIDNLKKNENLEILNIEINYISKISSLFYLKKLKKLNCSNNLISVLSDSDLSLFNKLISLEFLDFSGNDIIYSFQNLKIKLIYHCPTLIKLNRKIISEKDKKEADDYFNGKLTKEVLEKRIKEKNESNDSIDINFSVLVELDLSGLHLKDEYFMFDKKKYPNLKKLNISNNNFTTFEIFGSLPEISELNMSYNFLSELIPRKYIKNYKSRFNFSKLKILDISNNKLTSIIGIQNFIKLRKINLKENEISKIDSLDKLNDLYYINISNNNLRSFDKSSLGILPSLKTLLCDNNFFKNVNCFEKFTSLEQISFNSNKINDMTCLDKLSQLKKLMKLSLINNPITHIENYRRNIIVLFQKLKFLDNKEIMAQERILNSYNENNTNLYLKESKQKKEDIFKSYNTFNENIKNPKMRTNIKEASKKINLFNKGYRLFPFYDKDKKSNYDYEIHKTPKRVNYDSRLELNINILQSKNDKDFNRFLFLSQGSNEKKNVIPALKLSKSKKYDEIILFNKYKNKRKLKRPFSSTNTRNLINKTSKIIGKRNDHFSIVLNSFGNNNYTPLVTLKNFNVKKIDF